MAQDPAAQQYQVKPARPSFIDKLRQIFNGIHTTGFTFFGLVVFTLLLGNDQIGDIILQMNVPEHFITYVALFWLSMHCWWCGRFIFNHLHKVGPTEPITRQLLTVNGPINVATIKWLPRVYGFAPGAIVSVYAIHRGYSYVALCSLATALTVLILVSLRRKGIRSIGRQSVVTSPWLSANTWGLITLMLWFISAVIAVGWTYVMGDTFGAGFVIFWGFGSIMWSLTYFTYLAFSHSFLRRFTAVPYPILLPVLSIALLVSVLFDTDNHEIRAHPLADNQRYAFADFDQAWQAFKRQAGNYHHQSQLEDKPRFTITLKGQTYLPAFFIATQGGGLRASYWTSLVLSELEKNNPGFHRYIFSLAGVSGGAVGNVFYTAALANYQACLTRGQNNCYLQAPLLEAVGKDYLSGVVTSFIHNDLIYRFLPIPFAPLERDRAQVLEQDWERGFAASFPYNARVNLTMGFQALYQQSIANNSWLPLILSMSSHQESGRRIITAPFPVEPKIFIDQGDIYARRNLRTADHTLLGDMNLSTVALNAARFPYITPAGTLNKPSIDSDMPKGHILDGGYHENYGAQATANMLQYLSLLQNKVSPSPHSSDDPAQPIPFIPIVILITNDPSRIAGEFSVSPTLWLSANTWPVSGISGPLQGIVSTRKAHTMAAIKQLKVLQQRQLADLRGSPNSLSSPCHAWLDEHQGVMHFMLPEIEQSEQQVPLGWWLSKTSKKHMRQQFSAAHTPVDSIEHSSTKSDEAHYDNRLLVQALARCLTSIE
ncbi:MAG: hypothetical protein ACJA13_002141 [Paraglaciecola sp.]|jgi:hypothetical protein